MQKIAFKYNMKKCIQIGEKERPSQCEHES